jgi:hypothetical protein
VSYFGLHTSGMHGFVMDEAELGFRVAAWLDEEQAEAGMAWLLDLQYADYVREEEKRRDHSR